MTGLHTPQTASVTQQLAPRKAQSVPSLKSHSSRKSSPSTKCFKTSRIPAAGNAKHPAAKNGFEGLDKPPVVAYNK